MRAGTGSTAFVALLLGAAVLGACRLLPVGQETSGADATIEIRVMGGMCLPGTFCGWRAHAAESDGSWLLVEGDDESSGTVEPAAVQEVADWFVDHHDEFTADAFVGECPTAFDGPETTIVAGAIPTGPQAHLADAEYWETASCQHAWPPDLVDEFLAVWDRAGIPRLDPVPLP